MKLKQFGLFFLITCTSVFFACNDDDNEGTETDYAQEISGSYKAPLTVTITPEGGEKGDGITSTKKISLVKTGDNRIKMELKDFSLGNVAVGDIALDGVSVSEKDGIVYLELKDATPSVTDAAIQSIIIENSANLEATVKDKKTLDMTLTLRVTGIGTVEVKITNGEKLAGDVSSDAKITELTFDSEFVLEQPVIEEGKTDITLYVKDKTTDEDLAALPFAIKVSEKAAVIEPTGSTLDLSGGSARIIVRAEDLTEIEYTVNVSKAKNFFDMEEWVAEAGENEIIAYKPGESWASSNPGLMLLYTFLNGIAGKDFNLFYNVSPSGKEDAYRGEKAAKIETVDSKGEQIFSGFYAPKVTSGSLFTGIFDPNEMFNPLACTKFGIPFEKKPLTVKGYYKYKAGDEYHYCPNPSAYHITEVKEDIKDQCSIEVYLYEYDPEQAAIDAASGKYTTYLDGTNIKTSDKVVAKAKLEDGSDKAEYTEFTLQLEYTEGTYSKDKSYRLAIITSSSKDGDTFSGAPGSVLYLDDIEIISEVQ